MLYIFKYLDVWSHAWKVCMIRNENLLISRRPLISLKRASLKLSFFQRLLLCPRNRPPFTAVTLLANKPGGKLSSDAISLLIWQRMVWHPRSVDIWKSYWEQKGVDESGVWAYKESRQQGKQEELRMITRFKRWGMVIESLQGGSREGSSSGNLKVLSSSYG